MSDLAHRYPLCIVRWDPSIGLPAPDGRASEEIRGKLHDPRVVAVGEIGLDYYWDTSFRDAQKYWFECQMEMARTRSFPWSFIPGSGAGYARAHEKHRAEEIGGVVHCFSYSAEIAKEVVKMGFFIGIGGVITFKNARKLKEVADQVPIENIVLETDCPYLAPVPFRGKRNSSLYLPYVVEELAKIKGIDTEEVIERTAQNARRLYSRITDL